MNLLKSRLLFALLIMAFNASTGAAADRRIKSHEIPLITPAATTGTGLLLEPALDLAYFTTEDFQKAMATVGIHRINKNWTSPILPLKAEAGTQSPALTAAKIEDYMLQMRDHFDSGQAIPMSDVGLISSQEDVIRRPMLNHISAFSNNVMRGYLLVQKTSTDKGWGYFAIVQDLTANPVLDYYAELKGRTVKFEGATCYKCHSSGPLAIHPAREDLVNDPKLAAALSLHIAEQPRSVFHFPAGEKVPEYGKALELKFCSRCHSEDGDRAPLYKVHAHPIRILVDFGYMPPNRKLRPDEIGELKAWLEKK